MVSVKAKIIPCAISRDWQLSTLEASELRGTSTQYKVRDCLRELSQSSGFILLQNIIRGYKLKANLLQKSEYVP